MHLLHWHNGTFIINDQSNTLDIQISQFQGKCTCFVCQTGTSKHPVSSKWENTKWNFKKPWNLVDGWSQLIQVNGFQLGNEVYISCNVPNSRSKHQNSPRLHLVLISSKRTKWCSPKYETMIFMNACFLLISVIMFLLQSSLKMFF